MIHIKDNFLSDAFYQFINSNLELDRFSKTDVGDTDFYTKESSIYFDQYVLFRLQELEKRKLENILSFFRVATDELDTTWRIHSDLNVNGVRPDRALVLYLSDSKLSDLNGTAFWEHSAYGKQLPVSMSDEDYNETISLDANDLEKWTLKSVVGHEPNRLVSYPANYFHSKYPNKAWPSGRKVFVMFYKFA